VPPHLVGDLERTAINNFEQQSLDFVMSVVLPYVRIFEAAMERDLLTDADRAGGVIIRFNVDAALRGDFKTRQEGLKIQREAGVINPNEWREREGLNPRKGGEEYWEQGPSGQGATPAKVPAGAENGDGEPAAVRGR
jgi:HK97 family phage portal protein